MKSAGRISKLPLKRGLAHGMGGFDSIPSNSSISSQEEFPNTIFITGMIDDQDGMEFYKLFHQLDLTMPVCVVINTNGGDLHSAFTIRDIMKIIRSETTLLTCCLGNAYSAGSLLLASGTKGARFVSPNGSVMIHTTQVFMIGGNFSTEVIPQLEHVRELTNNFHDILAEEITKDSKEKLSARLLQRNKRKLKEKFLMGDHYLSPEQAIEFGIADEIAIIELPYFPINEEEETEEESK